MQNAVAKRQTDLLKLEVLRAYFDFSQGRPTAESVAEKLNIPVRTVREWLADRDNSDILDEIVPLWPNTVASRQYASGHVKEALETIATVMKTSKSDSVKLQAAQILLGLAGVRPPKEDESVGEGGEGKRPAVLLNLFLGGGQEPVQIIDGEARELPRVRVETSPQLSGPE